MTSNIDINVRRIDNNNARTIASLASLTPAQMLDVYQRPDCWVRPWQMETWYTRHIIALTQDCSRGLHSYVSARYSNTPMLPLRQRYLDWSIISVEIFIENIISVDSFLSLIKSILVLPSKPLLPLSDVNSPSPDFSSPFCCAASLGLLGWGLLHSSNYRIDQGMRNTGE